MGYNPISIMYTFLLLQVLCVLCKFNLHSISVIYIVFSFIDSCLPKLKEHWETPKVLDKP